MVLATKPMGSLPKIKDTLQSNSPTITDGQLKSLLREYAPITCISPGQSPVESSQGIDPGMADNHKSDPTEPTVEWTLTLRFS